MATFCTAFGVFEQTGFLTCYVKLFLMSIDPVTLALVTMVGGSILGILLERILKLTTFFKKLYCFLVNSQTQLKVSLMFSNRSRLKASKEMERLKAIFYKTDKDWRVAYKDDYKLVYQKDEIEISMILNPDSTVIMETGQMSIPIRSTKEVFNRTCDMMEKIAKELDFKLLQAEFKAKIPYYQKEVAEFHIPRFFNVKEYSLVISDNELHTEIKLVLGVLTATNGNISQLKSILDRVLAF